MFSRKHIRGGAVCAVLCIALTSCSETYNIEDPQTAEDLLVSMASAGIDESGLSDKQRQAAMDCFLNDRLPLLIPKLDEVIEGSSRTMRDAIDEGIERHREDPEAIRFTDDALALGLVLFIGDDLGECLAKQML